MSNNEERLKVRLDINGRGHQIAGRDLINEGDGFKPNPSNPNLRTCEYCEWPGLSRDAHECPKCGHNYLADHLAKQKQARQEFDNFKVLLVGVLALSLFGSMQLSRWFGLNLLEGIFTMLLILACLWLVSIQIRVRFEHWCAKRKRREDG